MVREGLSRGEAARLSGVQMQTLRDWDMPKANAQTFNTHLEEISSVAGDDAITVVLLDQAGWHGAKTLKITDNIALLPRPPYSSELNPIENVWQFGQPMGDCPFRLMFMHALYDQHILRHMDVR